MKVMACDLATVSGIAVDGPGGKPRGITYRLPTGGNDLGGAGLAFSDWLHGLASIERPDLIALEAPVLGNTGAKVFTSEMLVGLAFMAEVVSKSLHIPTVRAHVQTVRRHLLGNGRPRNPKRAVIDRCRLLGWAPKNDNEADAMALWLHTKARLDRTFRIETGTPLFAGARA